MPSRLLRRGRIAAVLVLLFLAATSAAADSLTIAWDASPDSRVRGYVVFVGVTPGHPMAATDVGAVTSYVFPAALPGGTYYFSVASYDGNRTIGTRSKEVVAQIPGSANAPPAGTRVAAAPGRTQKSLATGDSSLSMPLPSAACSAGVQCYTAAAVLDGAGAITALAATRDGRVFFVEDARRVRVVSASGDVETALVPYEDETRVAGLALDPAFAETGLAFTAETSVSANGDGELRIMRYRVVDNRFGERAVIAAGLPAGGAAPLLAIDTMGHLFAAIPATTAAPASSYEGLLLRLMTSGTVPRDNPLPTPAYARSPDLPTGVAHDTVNGTLLLAGTNRIPAAEVTKVRTGEVPAAPPVASTLFLAGPAGQLLRADRNADGSYRITAFALGGEWTVAAASATDTSLYVAITAPGQPGAILRLYPPGSSQAVR